MNDHEHALAERRELEAWLEAFDNHDREACNRHWLEFCRLHFARSPEVVRRMEEERGLL